MRRDSFYEWVESVDAMTAIQDRTMNSYRHAEISGSGNTAKPRIGAMKGKLKLPEDFDAPLPDDIFAITASDCGSGLAREGGVSDTSPFN